MRPLLTAHWTQLLTATYETEKKLLQKFLPAKTELNAWNGKYFMSLVGFMFQQPVLLGVPLPFYRSFEEINLRFYVRHKENNKWTNAVVFIKEIAPSFVIGLTAACLYREHFISLPMKHAFTNTGDHITTSYSCKIDREWNDLQLTSSIKEATIQEGSMEAFIRDHYVACTKLNAAKTREFRIEHPPWKIFPSITFKSTLDIARIYGKEFVDYFAEKPMTSFLMDGSLTHVSWPVLL